MDRSPWSSGCRVFRTLSFSFSTVASSSARLTITTFVGLMIADGFLMGRRSSFLTSAVHDLAYIFITSFSRVLTFSVINFLKMYLLFAMLFLIMDCFV
jgi:hypothetical protein